MKDSAFIAAVTLAVPVFMIGMIIGSQMVQSCDCRARREIIATAKCQEAGGVVLDGKCVSVTPFDAGAK